jgi:preprotein translocase subunit SecD
MSKFLHLLEEFNPENTGDPKWDLIDYLKSKDVDVRVDGESGMIFVDTGGKEIPLQVSGMDNEEEAESIDAGTGTYKVDQEVEKLGSTAASGLKGMAGRMVGTAAQKAKRATKKRQQLAGKAVETYEKGTKALEDALATANRPQPIRTRY